MYICYLLILHKMRYYINMKDYSSKTGVLITKNELQSKFAQSLGISKVYFKREDLHPYGSHKGRSIPVMIDRYISQGIFHFAISSSGNAALAAAFYINKINSAKHGLEMNKVKLDILVGQHIIIKKLRYREQFKSDYINITMHDRPIQTLFNKIKDPSIKGLRQSTDDSALLGYEELSNELIQIEDLKAVFIGTSSGTTAQALSEYFDKVGKKIEVHVIQTSSCHPISSSFVDDPIDEVSIADAIVDHSAIRKERIVELIDQHGGAGWIASNEQIKSAQTLVKKYANLDISTNSALSVAGLMQAVYTGRVWEGSVACMICGD